MHRAADLLAFATGLLRAAGLPEGRAAAVAVAEVLLEADLLGHTTHGLDMLAAYHPLAAGFPTGGDPVLMDISMSTRTR